MIRFLADANLDEAIVAGCLRREPAMDFRSAGEAQLEGLPDDQVLGIAAAQQRILVSHDFQTMPAPFGDFLLAYGTSPGVLLVRQSLPVATAIEELVLIWAASDSGEWTNRILKIPLS